MARTACFLAALLWFVAAFPAHCGTDAPEREPAINFQQTFPVPCSAALIRAFFSDVELAAALWNAYGRMPAYEVSATGSSGEFSVRTATGLPMTGTVRPHAADGLLDFVWECTGVFDWGIFADMPHDAVMTAQLYGFGNSTSINFRAKIYDAGLVSKGALAAGSWPIQQYISRRMRLHLADICPILDDIERNPSAVRMRIPKEFWQRFRQAFE